MICQGLDKPRRGSTDCEWSRAESFRPTTPVWVSTRISVHVVSVANIDVEARWHTTDERIVRRLVVRGITGVKIAIGKRAVRNVASNEDTVNRNRRIAWNR